jgi:glycine/D-amino acid oxidase-like deaminating enzyme
VLDVTRPPVTGGRDPRSLWQARRLPPLARIRPSRAEFTDVLVVGAGVAGALIAEMLVRDGHRVLVADPRGPARGQAAAGAGVARYETDAPLTALAGRIGAGDAARAWRRAFLSLHGLLARTRDLGIDCDLEPRDTLDLAGGGLGADDLAAEAEARRAIGLETSFLSRSALARRFRIDRPAALLGHAGFGADPRRLAAGYLRAAAAAGARLAAPLEIADVEYSRDCVVAHTRTGWISCRTLVLADGDAFPDLAPGDPCSRRSSCLLATRPQPRRLWPGRCLIREASGPGFHCRTTPDGRAILGAGSEEEAATGGAPLAERVRALGAKARQLFPRLDVTPEFAWTGAAGTGNRGLPAIGAIPGRPGCWAVLGGDGMTSGRLAAEIIRTALAGGTDPDADLYAFPAPAPDPQGSESKLGGP